MIEEALDDELIQAMRPGLDTIRSGARIALKFEAEPNDLIRILALSLERQAAVLDADALRAMLAITTVDLESLRLNLGRHPQ